MQLLSHLFPTGNIVVGGAINLTSLLYVQATHIGGESTLAQIIALIEDAQSSKVCPPSPSPFSYPSSSSLSVFFSLCTLKAPIQQLADRISAFFVPCIILLSLASLIFWIVLGFSRPSSIRGYIVSIGFLSLLLSHPLKEP